MTSPRNLALFLEETAERSGSGKALSYKSSGGWTGFTWKEAWEKVLQWADIFGRLSVKDGDRIALWSENRPEWLFADFACLATGAVSVPVYVTLADMEIRYILNNSGSSVLVVSKAELLERMDPYLDSIPELKSILLVEGDYRIRNPKAHQVLFYYREILRSLEPGKAREIRSAIREDAYETVASIVYTSGTTGKPKGVMLTHGNFIANCLQLERVLPFRSNDVHLSILPLSHILERCPGQFLLVRLGISIYYAEGTERVRENIREVKPTIILAVPRLYQKVHREIMKRIGALSGYRKIIADWGLECARRTSEDRLASRPISFGIAVLAFGADRLVLASVRKAFGGRCRFCISGGAPLDEALGRFFYSIGILIVEGYGLTETSPVITANRINRFKFGTVGLPIPGVEVRISPEGEVLTKSGCVMQGYYRFEEETRRVLQDGWFRTGDLGELDGDGFLKLTGRLKEIIVTSGGKKICPEMVERFFEKHPPIRRCVLYGEGKNFLTALIVPDFEYLNRMAAERNQAAAPGDLIREAWVAAEVEKAVHQTHEHLAPYEQVKCFHLLEHDFSQEGGEMTPTLKLKRNIIYDKYKIHLERFYGK